MEERTDHGEIQFTADPLLFRPGLEEAPDPRACDLHSFQTFLGRGWVGGGRRWGGGRRMGWELVHPPGYLGNESQEIVLQKRKERSRVPFSGF